MTAAKEPHLVARRLMLDHLDMHPGKAVNNDLDPLEAGVVGNADHRAGGDSYHLGEDQIRRTGHRYTVDESARDRRGLNNYASGVDYGYFKVTTPRGTFDLYDYNAWLIDLCRAGDPDTGDLREVIYSPDGKTVKRWDDLGIRSTGDLSHRTHTHHSEYRDADGTRMLRLARRWLQHIGLIEEDDDVNLTDKLDLNTAGDVQYSNPTTTVGGVLVSTNYFVLQRGNQVLAELRKAELRDTAILAAVQGVDEETVLARVAELAAQLAKVPAEVADALTDGARTPEDTAAALRVVLGDRAAAVGRLLAGTL